MEEACWRGDRKGAGGGASDSGALIEAAPIGRHGAEARTVADARGRFQLSVAPGQALAISRVIRRGQLAGFTAVGAEANDVRAFAVAGLADLRRKYSIQRAGRSPGGVSRCDWKPGGFSHVCPFQPANEDRHCRAL